MDKRYHSGSMRKRLVLAITGIRSEYDILYPVLDAIRRRDEMDVQIFVTGAHCSKDFGKTEKLISADGFKIADRAETLLASDSLASRVKAIGFQIPALVQTIERISPTFLLVAGDREETITAALCGTYMNVPVAHMCGGDYAEGNADDSVRHAVTKLAHIHFPMSKKSAERIIKMGEEPWRVVCAGNPALDRLIAMPAIGKAELSKRLNFDLTKKPLVVVLQHPITSESKYAGKQMEVTLGAISKMKHPTIVIYPNSDAGSADIIQAIERWLPQNTFAKAFKNLPRAEFVNLMRNADVLVGNSSMGILEAPTLKLPVVNIGNRQKGREHADNVIFVGHNEEEITSAINKALYDKKFLQKVKKCKSPFGDGRAGERIARVLATLPVDEKLLIKKGTY